MQQITFDPALSSDRTLSGDGHAIGLVMIVGVAYFSSSLCLRVSAVDLPRTYACNFAPGIQIHTPPATGAGTGCGAGSVGASSAVSSSSESGLISPQP